MLCTTNTRFTTADLCLKSTDIDKVSLVTRMIYTKSNNGSYDFTCTILKDRKMIPTFR